MKIKLFIITIIITMFNINPSQGLSKDRAPVIHIGKYHLLSCGHNSVLLDESRGLSMDILTETKLANWTSQVIKEKYLSLTIKVELDNNGFPIQLDQAYDSNPRLQIISQGPNQVAARIFFSLYSQDEISYGTGTIDLYIFDGRINIIPSIFIDYKEKLKIFRAGLTLTLPAGGNRFEIKNPLCKFEKEMWIQKFGEDRARFELSLENKAGQKAIIGWLRNRYPKFLYLREIDQDPQKDKLYEKWPPWISQRGPQFGWKFNEDSTLEGRTPEDGPWTLNFLWVSNGCEVPRGGYQAFNSPLVIALGKTESEVEMNWESYSNPKKPVAIQGDFRFYNEKEGVYEIDSKGKPLEVIFDGTENLTDRQIVARIWNLKGSGGYEFKADGQPVLYSLLNDGDLIDDPMVFIKKEATGPARQAIVSFHLPKGKKIKLKMQATAGMQLTYQMYSELETYEAWSDKCKYKPLFYLPLREVALYKVTLPSKNNYAFFKLPLYMMKNGVNPATFMNQLWNFKIISTGPKEIEFQVACSNLQNTGKSFYSCSIPYEADKITLNISAKFIPLDDGQRWTQLEYCDLYPFEDVYRRNFYYNKVIYLTKNGEFDSTGTGAWGMRFQEVPEPERLGYYSEYVKRYGPGSKVPDPQDGKLWILGDNPERGNILFRQVKLDVSPGVLTEFTLCNAWVDIHNVIINRQIKTAEEKVSYVIEVFPGALPTLNQLSSFWERDVGKKQIKIIKSIKYSSKGEIQGFYPKK